MSTSHLRAARAVVVFVSVLALAVPASAAGWKRVNPTSQFLTNFYNVSVVPNGPGVTLAWGWHASATAASADSASTATFTPTLADPAPLPVIGAIATSWTSLDNDIPLLTFDGGMKALVGGWPGGSGTGFGAYAIPLDAAGNGGAPVTIGPSSGDDLGLTAVLAAGRPLWATSGGTVFRDIAPAQPGIPFHPYTCCSYAATVASDAVGNVWIAWFSNATDHSGLFLRQVDPATGTPVGEPLPVPGFAGIFDNRIPLVCNPLGAGCRIVFIRDAAAVPGDEAVMSWAPGEPQATLISKITSPRGLDASYDAQGRLWVGWYDRGDLTRQRPDGYFITRGDAKGVGGTIGNVGQPMKREGLANDWQLRVQNVGDNLLLLPTWDAGDGNIGVYAGFFGPPKDALPAPGPRDADVQLAPGGKGFRIQVQFNVPKACAKPCSARAELRVRSGRRLYAVKPLPGDSKVVLGTRGGVPLANGAGKKIRFYLTVSKAQLLKAPFTTQGGFRAAETRLRVWIKNGTTETLYVRDGRIRVSIARIRSGALPGLAGIL